MGGIGVSLSASSVLESVVSDSFEVDCGGGDGGVGREVTAVPVRV